MAVNMIDKLQFLSFIRLRPKWMRRPTHKEENAVAKFTDIVLRFILRRPNIMLG